MEQEWMNAMEDSLLPEGWQEGEDLFDSDAGEGGPTTEAPDGGIPTAGEEAKAEAPRTYRLKVNHEEKEVTLSQDEVVARLQKSYAFDAMKERRDRDYAAEVRQLQRLYPDFREMPDEVAHLAAEGESLLTAYAVWQGREAEKRAQSLREENRVLRQNASAAARAPVKGVGGGADGSGYTKVELPKVQAVSVPKADTAELEAQLKETLEAAKTQAGAAIDAKVDQSVRELQQTQQQAEAGFDAQRRRIDLEEALGKDAQALYAEVRGDRGGIGAAQYDSITNAAAENRLAVSREQRRLATDTAAKIAQLRAQGEYEKADQALELTQDYLSRLTDLARWAAEYDLNAAKFQENVSQWRAEYEAEQQKLEGQRLEQEAEQAETVRKNLAQTGKTLLELGIMPSASQLEAMGMDETQAAGYLAAAKVTAAGKGSGKSGSSGSGSAASADKNSGAGEYALYLNAMESAGDPRTYVKSHYKAYGLSALPEASAYERWRSGLAEPMDMEGFETFLRKLSISLSEDPISGTNAMTAKFWPTMTAAQRKSTEEVYETYGKHYVYGS